MTLFVVDDDEIDRETILRSLEERGLENPVRTARDGEEALAILKGEGGEPIRMPYLILLDLNMPRMNGIELLRHIRRDPELKRAVVFVLTTSNAESDRTAAYDLNVAGYILKARAGLEFERVVELIDQFERNVEFPN
ncbi:MAG: response regulator [Pseudomonadota bacterium]|nr:response regulator [Pseudomonadota bacterium]